jgi:hypothetical protein
MAFENEFGKLGAMTPSGPVDKAKRTHTQARSVANLRLDTPGRVRVGHMMTLLSVSHSTLYERIKSGAIPKPDGKDGRPYWHTSTVQTLLSK